MQERESHLHSRGKGGVITRERGREGKGIKESPQQKDLWYKLERVNLLYYLLTLKYLLGMHIYILVVSDSLMKIEI